MAVVGQAGEISVKIPVKIVEKKTAKGGIVSILTRAAEWAGSFIINRLKLNFDGRHNE